MGRKSAKNYEQLFEDLISYDVIDVEDMDKDNFAGKLRANMQKNYSLGVRVALERTDAYASKIRDKQAVKTYERKGKKVTKYKRTKGHKWSDAQKKWLKKQSDIKDNQKLKQWFKSRFGVLVTVDSIRTQKYRLRGTKHG